MLPRMVYPNLRNAQTKAGAAQADMLDFDVASDGVGHASDVAGAVDAVA